MLLFTLSYYLVNSRYQQCSTYDLKWNYPPNTFVSNEKMNYVLTNEFLSDRIEAEFGIWRQLSGGNYHISMQQVLTSLSFQRLKLFHKLQCELSSKHEGENCCLEELSEEDWDNVATCFQRNHVYQITRSQPSITFLDMLLKRTILLLKMIYFQIVRPQNRNSYTLFRGES